MILHVVLAILIGSEAEPYIQVSPTSSSTTGSVAYSTMFPITSSV